MYSAVVVQEATFAKKVQEATSLQRRQEPWRWGCGGWPLDVDSDQLRAIIEMDPLTTTWEAAEELNVDCFTVIWHLKQIGKVERFNKRVPHELTESKKKKKIIVLKCCFLFFYAATVNSFPIGLWHVMKSGFYTTISDDQLSGWTEKKLQSTSPSQTCTTKRS